MRNINHTSTWYTAKYWPQRWIQDFPRGGGVGGATCTAGVAAHPAPRLLHPISASRLFQVCKLSENPSSLPCWDPSPTSPSPSLPPPPFLPLLVSLLLSGWEAPDLARAKQGLGSAGEGTAATAWPESNSPYTAQSRLREGEPTFIPAATVPSLAEPSPCAANRISFSASLPLGQGEKWGGGGGVRKGQRSDVPLGRKGKEGRIFTCFRDFKTSLKAPVVPCNSKGEFKNHAIASPLYLP